MSKTYAEYAAESKSEKIVCGWIEPLHRVVLFTLHSGAIYKKTPDNFVSGVQQDDTQLIRVFSTSLNAGEFYYDIEANVVYIRMTDDSNPNTKEIGLIYRIHVATTPLSLPWDLVSASADVYFDGRLSKNTKISRKLDDENIGVAVESRSDIFLDNGDGFYEDIADVYVWENKSVELYSWNPKIPLLEKKLLYKGKIQDKSITVSSFGLKLQDFIFEIREPLNSERFDETDGSVPDTYIGTPKRRLYGQLDKLKCVPIDSVENGFTLTGTLTGSTASATITGVGTTFLTELSPEDTIKIGVESTLYEVIVNEVLTPTTFTISENSEFDFSGVSAVVEPIVPYRKANRRWHIAGHKLREATALITEVVQLNRYVVDDVKDDFNAGDVVSLGGEEIEIKRIAGNMIVLQQNTDTLLSVSDPIVKNPVSAAFIGSKETLITRDYTVSNTSTDAILIFGDDAEFNITKSVELEGTYTWTNGSRSVVVTGGSPKDDIKPRDWIRPNDVATTVFYEVLQVKEAEVVLRIAYAEVNKAIPVLVKKVEYLSDRSLVTVDTVGAEATVDGSLIWLRTPSDAVRHLLESDAGLTDINIPSFSDSKNEANYTLSIAFPLQVGDEAPQIRKAIDLINKSCFGSLVNNTNFQLTFDILSQTKPQSLITYEDHDIDGAVSVTLKNEIVRKVNIQYRHFIDIFNNEEASLFYEYENGFVTRFVGSTEERSEQVYLYDTRDAETVAQRYAFLFSLTRARLRFRGKMDFMLTNLNDKIILKLDRLYKRFGGNDRRKIGIVSEIKKDGASTEVVVSDMGNTFNRTANITPNTALNFTSAGSDEKLLSGYIVDNDVCLPDVTSEQEIGQNLIG